MSDYIVKLTDKSSSLTHHQTKGAHWGVVTKNVGKYYIPKRERNLDRAEKRYDKAYDKLAKDIEKKNRRYANAAQSVNNKYMSGKLDPDQRDDKLRKLSEDFTKDRDKFERRADSLEKMRDKIDRGRGKLDEKKAKYKDPDEDNPRKKKLSDLSDEELEKLMQRTNKEKVTYNNLDRIRKAEEDSEDKPKYTPQDKRKIASDMVNAAKDINRTLSSKSEDYRRNPPTKPQKPADLTDVSDEDVRRLINRAKLENEYNSVVNTPQVDKGKMRVAAAMAGIGSAVVLGTQVANLALTIKQLKE